MGIVHAAIGQDQHVDAALHRLLRPLAQFRETRLHARHPFVGQGADIQGKGAEMTVGPDLDMAEFLDIGIGENGLPHLEPHMPTIVS